MSAEEKTIDQGFNPVVGDKPRVLVLGTMPSVKSLEELQYYGHPRNAFWWIMSQLCGFSAELSYQERLLAIKDAGIAIWDVVYSCHRPGSLDSNIDQSTLVPNDIPRLLKDKPDIALIAFNGQAAAKLFNKYINDDSFKGRVICLPSTSPANAAKSREQKLEEWRALKGYLQIS